MQVGGVVGQKPAVTDEDIIKAIGIPGDQVTGIRGKRHVAAIGANAVVEIKTIPLRPVCRHAHPRGLLGQAVMDEGISRAICVPGDQVAGIGAKRYVAAIGAEAEGGTNTISLRPV
ncbi:MAG: hypothetical protein ABL884_09685 [Methyloglobulus sp.]